jgi:hypothetical protein
MEEGRKEMAWIDDRSSEFQHMVEALGSGLALQLLGKFELKQFLG